MRAVGIVRVSERGTREGDSFRSPAEQRERIVAAVEREGGELVAVHEEIDVSGGADIDARHGLTKALRTIEAGEADVLMVAYFDRLVRSLRVQGEVVSRVEAAGGRVRALDVGEISEATAAQWVSGTTIGMMSEYYRRSIGERVAGAQALAVEAGVWPSRVPVGYQRGPDGVLEPDPLTAHAVRRAFTERADGASIREVRAYLRAQGIERTYAAVEKMLRSRAYLGEIHFGKLVNHDAHSALVPPAVWTAAQRVRVPRGPAGQSDRLLARLGVLRCGTCDARMSAGGRRRYPVYRCNAPDCTANPSIMAHVAERVVVEAIHRVYRDARGRASVAEDAQQAVVHAEQAQADLDAAIRAFAGVTEEAAATERLAELREARDRAVEEAHRLGGLRAAHEVSLEDWDRFTLAERRAVIRASGVTATVGPGRGAERITVKLLGE